MRIPASLHNIEKILVYYDGYGEHRLVGTLVLDGSKPVFGYDEAWAMQGLPLSPITMPNQNSQGKRLFYGQHATNHFLCGLLADSLPDGWGMLLMDRFFRQKLKKPPHTVNVLDRFAYIGQNGNRIGALSFEPEHQVSSDTSNLDLYTLAQANDAILAGQDTDILNELLLVGGSPQGARPKALVYYDSTQQRISTHQNQLNQYPKTKLSQASTSKTAHQQLEPWLVKFPAQHEHKSVCLLESLYADYATQAGLCVPTHRYFDISHQHGAFGVKRFDRQLDTQGQVQPVHIHTLAGLLDIDFRMPSIDYTQWLRCARMMTGSQQQVEQAYRHAVFNVVFNNKDDHSKNISFTMNKQGQWSLSPSYDLTYNTGINGYHQMDVCGEAKHPNRADLLKLANQADIKQTVASSIIEAIVSVAQKMLSELPQYGLATELTKQVAHDVKANIKRMQKNS